MKCKDPNNNGRVHDPQQLCATTKKNDTYYEMFIASKDNNRLPQNYFCKFQFPFTNHTIPWAIKIYRADFLINTENIMMALYSGSNDSPVVTYYNDDYLRLRSYATSSNPGDRTSWYSLDVKDSIFGAYIYAVNNLPISGTSFKIVVTEDISVSRTNWLYLSMSILFCMFTCCFCLKAVIFKILGNTNIDWNVDEPNQNWDDDQLRVYYVRRLRRQIEEQRRLEQSNAAELEEELRKKE